MGSGGIERGRRKVGVGLSRFELFLLSPEATKGDDARQRA
jgi:hypothetical protein